MVGRLLRVFNREWGGLHEAAFLLALTALFSQVLGLVRDRLLAGHFGAGDALDIYYAAFRVPDFLYASVASFVAVTVLIPFLLERIEGGEGGWEAARRFINGVFTTFAIVMIFVCGLFYWLMPAIADQIVPGFTEAKRDSFILFSRLLLLSPFLFGISNLFGAVTQSLRRFFVFAAGPVLYNVGILFGIVFLMPRYGLEGVVYGVIFGALLHVVVQLPVLFAHDIVPRPTARIGWMAIKQVVLLSIPRTIALSAMNIATIILIALASKIAPGAIAVFALATNLQNIPLAIIGMSYSVAAFPTLAKLWTKGNYDEFLSHITVAMRHILFWSFPAIVLFIVLRAQIVRTVLGSGAFDWTATRLTAALLALFALSVVAQNLVLLLTRAFYAMGRTRLPLVANLIGAVLVVVSSLAFLEIFRTHQIFRYFAETLLRVAEVDGTPVLMLALGFSFGMLGNAAILLFFLKREFPASLGVKRAFLHSFTASVAMGFVAYHGLQLFDNVLDTDTFLGIFLQGLFAGVSGILAGIFLLRLMENRELDEIWESLHKKFWKTLPIAAEREGL